MKVASEYLCITIRIRKLNLLYEFRQDGNLKALTVLCT